MFNRLSWKRSQLQIARRSQLQHTMLPALCDDDDYFAFHWAIAGSWLPVAFNFVVPFRHGTAGSTAALLPATM